VGEPGQLTPAGDITPEQANAFEKLAGDTGGPRDWYNDGILKRGRWTPESVAASMDHGEKTGDWGTAAKVLKPLWKPHAPQQAPATNYAPVRRDDGSVEYVPLPRNSATPVRVAEPTDIEKRAAQARLDIQRHHSGEAPLPEASLKAKESIIRAAEGSYSTPGTVINLGGYGAKGGDEEGWKDDE
jgi:hypothetical protein